MNPIFKRLIQVGMVVPNLLGSMSNYVYSYGIGPMYVTEFNSKNVEEMQLYGKRNNYSMKIGVCPVGDVRFELIEPITKSIYSDFLLKNGSNIIHHLKLEVDNYFETLAHFDSIGIKTIQVGHQLGAKGKNIYSYLDTIEYCGFITEIVNVSEDFIKPEPECWFPGKKITFNPLFIQPVKIGIVVKNIKTSINNYLDLFGLEKCVIKDFNSRNIYDMCINEKRKDFTFKAAFYNLGNVQLELIEPISESSYSNFYNIYGENTVHHIGMKVNNCCEILRFLKNSGIKIKQSGNYLGKNNFYYLSTELQLNFITEIFENSSAEVLI